MVLRIRINERVNYLAQVTEFSLVQVSLAHMDTIIDRALLRDAGLPLELLDPLTHLTALILRSLPTELGWILGSIWRYSGLAGEIACLRGRYALELLAGATEELWTHITLGAAEIAVWTEVSGLFREDMDDESTQPPPSYNVAGLLFRAYYLASGESSPIWLHQPGAFSGGAAVRPHQHSGRGSRYQGRR